MSKHRGAKGGWYREPKQRHPWDINWPKQSDTDRIAQRAESEQARRKAGYWST